ncbi:hypothetical protein Mapa_009398 [Marchantia paleacea]|nr:hypothetical protein Mapa_009398 [Marchantia paleacea]
MTPTAAVAAVWQEQEPRSFHRRRINNWISSPSDALVNICRSGARPHTGSKAGRQAGRPEDQRRWRMRRQDTETETRHRRAAHALQAGRGRESTTFLHKCGSLQLPAYTAMA